MQLKSKLTAAASAVVLAAGVSSAAQAQLKIGFVYVGPIGDHGWSYEHNQGRLAIEKALGDKVTTTYVEKVPEGADALRVISKLATSGHGLIFTTSFGYMNPTLRAAKRFPNVKFEHATGFKRAPNLSTYSARFYEGRYVVGKIVGNMTKSNILGYIGSFPIPEVIRGINATYLAAKSVIDQGADIIMQHTDSPAPVQVAEQRGVWAVGQASDMTQFGPKAHLTSIIDNWSPYYIARAKAVLDGTWKSTDTWDGFKPGMVQLADYNKAIPADVVKLANETRAGIVNGTIHPFAGEIKDQEGKVRVKAGTNADDGLMAGMNFYVQGIDGTIPK